MICGLRASTPSWGYRTCSWTRASPDRDAQLRANLDRVLADPEPVRAALRRGYEEHLNKARSNRELLQEFARAQGRG